MKDFDSNSNLSTKATIVVGIFAALLTLSNFKTELEGFHLFNTEISAWAIGVIMAFLLVSVMYIYSLGYVFSLYPLVAKLRIFRYAENLGDLFFVLALLSPIIALISIPVALSLRTLLTRLGYGVEQNPQLLFQIFLSISVTAIVAIQIMLFLRSYRFRTKMLEEQIKFYRNQRSKGGRENNHYYLFELAKSIEANLKRLYSGLSQSNRNSFSQLVNFATQDNVITNYDRAQLLDLLDFRNQFAHGQIDNSQQNFISGSVGAQMITEAQRILGVLEQANLADKN